MNLITMKFGWWVLLVVLLSALSAAIGAGAGVVAGHLMAGRGADEAPEQAGDPYCQSLHPASREGCELILREIGAGK
jgi:hypothetical protein